MSDPGESIPAPPAEGATAEGMAAAVRAAIAAREDAVQAWEVLGWDALEAQAARLLARPDWRDLPLAGLPVGVKDIYDTADFPTAYGSGIYAGHRPVADAAAVTRLRAAGALLPGKTVTTEFAYWRPGKTRNPRALSRSPGGSSAGSAAAVAAGMVPLAVGSQTAASTVRPAAFCGIVGFKPTLGRISMAGVKGLAGSMDTAGVFARDVAGAGLLAGVLAGRPDWGRAGLPARPPALRLAPAPEWQVATPEMRARLEAVAEALARAGAAVERAELPAGFGDLCEVQARIMAAEAARDLAWEAHVHGDRLSDALGTLIETGKAMPPELQEADYAARDAAIARQEELFGTADLLIAPSAPGEAPDYESGTGNPDLSRAWTLLGLPSITLPAGTGPAGLPLGVQFAARRGADLTLLQAAAWIERHLSDDAD